MISEKIPNDLTKFDGMFCVDGPMDTWKKSMPCSEKKIKICNKSKKPYLGFCLSCQLLGEVVGGNGKIQSSRDWNNGPQVLIIKKKASIF